MHFLAEGKSGVAAQSGNVSFGFASWPIELDIPVSYDATDPPLPDEEDAEGNIIPRADLDDHFDALVEDDDDGEGADA
jgi:hypothetical protein